MRESTALILSAILALLLASAALSVAAPARQAVLFAKEHG